MTQTPKVFLKKSNISKLITQLVISRGMSHIEATNHLIKENDIDYSSIDKFLTDDIKGKIEKEAEDLNFLKKTNTLPI